MKKFILCWCCIAAFSSLLATSENTQLLHFKISRPYCIFNFLETCKGANGTSETLRQYIAANTSGDAAFKSLIDEYKALRLESVFPLDGFPETRPAYHSIQNLLIIAAVQTDDLEHFKARIVGILHNTDYEQLIRLMQKADVYYDKIIWSKHGKAAMHQLQQLRKYQKSANEAFARLKKLYRSSWSDEMPFTVALTPVPGKSGATTATPHANSLCADVLTEESDYAGRIAIVLHEICHVLYAEQSREVQYELEACFAGSTSPFSIAAHSFFDEGMATAGGNGWTYQFLTGKMDTAGWYSDPYIDGFGHALFPLVTRYLSEAKSIDAAFVTEAIRLFGEKFPKTAQDYGVLFNHLTLYSDEEAAVPRDQIKQDLFGQFAVAWLSFSTPILAPESTGALKESPGTQLVIVDRDYENVLANLKNILPDLPQTPDTLAENTVINYFDADKRLIVIAKIKKGEAARLFKALKEKQYMDTGELTWQY